MRILHVYSGNLFGGIESILVELARGQGGPSGLTHEFALSFEEKLATELAGIGSRVHRVGAVRMSRPATVRSARSALVRLIESGRFDRVVCHAPWSHAIFGGAVRRTSVPLIFWAHDVMTGRHWTERLARRVVPDLAICNSHFTAGTLRHLFPAVLSTVVYAPVASSKAARGAPGRDAIRAALSTPADAVVIIQASRCERWKGYAVLVEALARLRDVPRWVWWQAGGAQRPAEAAFLASLKQTATELGIADRVRWLGERRDVRELMAAADLYCQANLEPEPFGVAFVEALSAGLPVVTVAAGGACEIVDDSCGVLVPQADAAEIGASLRTLIEDDRLRARLAAAGPVRAGALCDPAVAQGSLADALAALSGEEVRR
jgi:glycosyltransferase involved in cell wall biosynthesis